MGGGGLRDVYSIADTHLPLLDSRARLAAEQVEHIVSFGGNCARLYVVRAQASRCSSMWKKKVAGKKRRKSSTYVDNGKERGWVWADGGGGGGY